ncbi:MULTISPECIES: hypothetical protein [Psychrobacter]|nr:MULTISPECIES: hypothetical protein [unclassified Psychrobacter]AGP48654.1 hypothetical protein PSYCG_05645 [Psychrobacter sp. G]MDA5132111.1 hypothetical protein [Psychrobacter sp. ANT_H3]
MKANIRTYLWGHESFTNTLKNDFVWDVDKYWDLEIFLLDIIKDIENKETVDKTVMADVYYLGRSIETAFSSTLNPYDGWSVENIDIEELTEYYDRFTHIMRIFWGKIPLRDNDYLLKENPLFKGL